MDAFGSAFEKYICENAKEFGLKGFFKMQVIFGKRILKTSL